MTSAKSLIFTALALAAWPAAAAEAGRPEWNSLGRELQHLLRASRDNFRGVEGARIENRRRESFFEAKTYLPEASYCRIFTKGATVFCCEWDGKGTAASAALFAKLVTSVQAALGTDWSKAAKDTARRKEVLFTGEARPVVHIILQSVPVPVQVYVLVLPEGSPKDGFSGEIPSIAGFVHP